MQDIILHPDRRSRPYRPIEAVQRMGKLIDDKEDTEQVFHIIDALSGNANLKDLKVFLKSDQGRRMLQDKPFLPPMLDDHDALRRLPKGSVGQAYVDFMEREGLSAAGLVAEQEKFSAGKPRYDDDLDWYSNRLRDTHDLYHVLTGYGRDALGELALLGFSHSQNGGFGVLFIAFMGRMRAFKMAPAEARIGDVVREGRRNGRRAERIIDQDIETLLGEPLSAARARLKIEQPVAYRRALSVFAQRAKAPNAPIAA